MNYIYDKFKHCGVDYSSVEVAKEYDTYHKKFRNFEKEVSDLLENLNLPNSKDLTLIDFGCGTGFFELYASKYFKKIYAIDPSKTMLEVAKSKTLKEDIKNVEYINSGFLNYKHKDDLVDLVTTKMALHHLSDFWKQIALFNINKALKIGGILYVSDIVFQFEAKDYETSINSWIDNLSKKVDIEFIKDIESHISDEFSTYDWIFRGLLEKAGFEIYFFKSADGFVSEYFCKKEKDI